jgi:DNA invertase Pin-like site-specific DNA recombinase
VNPASTISMGGLRAVCALYMRVSTKGHGQTTDTQALALRAYAERRGFEIVETKASAAVKIHGQHWIG